MTYKIPFHILKVEKSILYQWIPLKSGMLSSIYVTMCHWRKISRVHIVGKLDKSIYNCIEEKITIDEVIITDEQLLHIKERHPDVYENMLEYVALILQQPDYVIEDNKHRHSVMVIKRIETVEAHGLLLLRICTAQDPEGYKNSIITSWKISERRLQNYLRNKKILYRKE